MPKPERKVGAFARVPLRLAKSFAHDLESPRVLRTVEQDRRRLATLRAGLQDARTALVDVFNASNVSDQQQILYLLERIVWRARPAVNTLISSLAGSDHETRYLAVRALGAIGPAARSAVPALTARLNDVNNMVRLAAARALKNIDTETTVRPGTEP